jgi:hypothetical protein
MSDMMSTSHDSDPSRSISAAPRLPKKLVWMSMEALMQAEVVMEPAHIPSTSWWEMIRTSPGWADRMYDAALLTVSASPLPATSSSEVMGLLHQ